MSNLSRHCEERSDEAIHSSYMAYGLLPFARNDGQWGRLEAPAQLRRNFRRCRGGPKGQSNIERHNQLGSGSLGHEAPPRGRDCLAIVVLLVAGILGAGTDNKGPDIWFSQTPS